MANKRLYTILKEYLTKVFPIAEGGTGASTATGAVSNLKNDIVNLIYPVGSIYISYNSTSPATLFGGTWTQLKDRFLLGAGSTYSNGATGGASTVTLAEANLPSHTHTFTGSSVTLGTTGSHAHSVDGGNGGGGSWSLWDVYSNFPSTRKMSAHLYSAGAHTHSWTAAGTNKSAGSGNSHNNMPPYLTVYMWKRTA